VLDRAGVETLESRENLVPDARAKKAWISIRRVEAVRNLMSGHVGFDVRSSGADGGSNSVSIAGRQRGQAAIPRSTQDAHEDRLGAIVGVVARRDPTGARTLRRAPECLPAPGSRSSLQVASGRDLQACALERNIQRTREDFCDVQLVRTLRPQSVIDAMREEAECKAPAETGEDVQKGHGIGSAADRDQHRRPPWNEIALPEHGSHERGQGRRMRAGQRRRPKRSADLERLAELDGDPFQSVASRRRHVSERAASEDVVEMAAIFACEPEVEPKSLPSESFVDQRFHRLRRSSATTASTWLV